MPCPEPPIQALRALIAESRIDIPALLPPMAAGVFGYLGYDMVRLMEKLPAQKPDPIAIPDAVLVRPTIVVIFDAVQDTITVVTPVRPDPSVNAKAAHTRAVERLNAVVDALEKPLDKQSPHAEVGPIAAAASSNTTAKEFEAMVLRAKEYILAGDIFQVVLSQRFEAPFKLPPFALYRALRRVNPAPFLYLSRLRRLCGRGLQPGNSGARARGQGDRAADRRHQAAWRHPARGQGARRGATCPTPRSAPSISCCSTWAATTPAAYRRWRP